MSDVTNKDTSENVNPHAGWNVETLRVHTEAERKSDRRFQKERDRRYKNESKLRDKALRLQERMADRALKLASENQKLKEQQHNDVLNQWRDERGNYSTKVELESAIEKLEDIMKPLLEWISGRRGRDALGKEITQTFVAVGLGLAGLFGGVLAALLSHFLG